MFNALYKYSLINFEVFSGSVIESRDGKHLEIENRSAHDNFLNTQRQGHQSLPSETMGRNDHQHLLAPSLLLPTPALQKSHRISQDVSCLDIGMCLDQAL